MNHVIKIIFDDNEHITAAYNIANFLRYYLENENIIASVQISEEEFKERKLFVFFERILQWGRTTARKI